MVKPNLKRITLIICVIVLGIISLTACNKAETCSYVTTLTDVDGKRVGVIAGTLIDKEVTAKFPNAKIEYFNSTSDMAIALENGKIDVFAHDEPVCRMSCKEHQNQRIIGMFGSDEYGFVFGKNEKGYILCAQFDEMLEEYSNDGTIDELKKLWFGDDEERKVVSLKGLSAENGTLKFVTCLDGATPFVYMKDGEYVGYEIDLLARFCRRYGYDVEISETNFTGMLANIKSGKVNFGASCITITNERKESVLFSNTEYYGAVAIVGNTPTESLEFTDMDELNGKKIAVLLGSNQSTYLEKNYPSLIIEQYQNLSDMVIALDKGKVSAYVISDPTTRVALKAYANQAKMLNLYDEEYAFMFPKTTDGKKLQGQMNDFLAKIRESGELKRIDNIWFGTDDSVKKVDYKKLPSTNGKIKMCVSSSVGEPFAYIKNNEIVGYEVDIATRFCKEYGYGLDIEDSAFSGLLAGMGSGKYDMTACGITVTEEREEEFYFSDADYFGGVAVIVRKKGVSVKKDNLFVSVKESFVKTFIKEQRWKLFVNGIKTTLIITLLSIILGSVLGFGIYLLYRKGFKVVNYIIDGLGGILDKTPTVVILMILFYILFGSSSLDGTWVSVIGFGIMFAFSVSSLIKTGVGAIDKGQTEASLALGYTERQTFMKFILPQASKHFLPVYKNSIISLIKETAIVGYIAVQDLTRMSDIVRSRTYEAFFPLIVTAIIYFVLSWILIMAVKAIEIKTEPHKRSKEKVLKGVKTK